MLWYLKWESALYAEIDVCLDKPFIPINIHFFVTTRKEYILSHFFISIVPSYHGYNTDQINKYIIITTNSVMFKIEKMIQNYVI